MEAIFVYQNSPATVGIPARILGKVKRAPILFWVQDLWPESLSAIGAVRSPWLLSAVGQLVRWIYRGCACILVQSEAFVEPVMRMGVRRDSIKYFPNSAENLYTPMSSTAPWNGPELPDGFRVMFAGNLGKAQSLSTILTAAEQLKSDEHIHWVIVGDGREMAWLRSEISRRGLEQSVHVMGRHPVEDMPTWFAQADVMLATLSKDPIFALTIPAKIQSYMACAKPIIASIDGEGSRTVEAAGAGIGVPAEDATALAKAVSKMSEMPSEQRAALGQRGYAYFQSHFASGRLLDRLDGWLAEVVGGVD